jgi:hypothetical protein
VKCRPEHLLLFYASLWEHDDRIRTRVRDLCGAGIDWSFLVDAAETFGVCAGLNALLSSSGVECPFGEDRLRRAKAYETAATASMLSLYGEVSSLLERSGIPFMPLKGCDCRIAEGARRISNPMEDVDILIRGEDVEEAGEALVRNGYLFLGSGSGAHMNFATDGDRTRFIEVHWDLVNRRSPVQRSLFRPRIAAVLERSVSVGGRMHMSREDLVCYLTVHAVKEYFHRPKWLADIAYTLNVLITPAFAGQKPGTPHEGMDAGVFRAVIAEWNAASALGIAVWALVSATGDAGYEAAYGFGAYRPGFPGRFLAERLLRYDELRGMRPLLWIACAKSPGEVCAVTAGMFRRLMAGG